MTYFGIATADNRVTDPVGHDPSGIPIYQRPHPSGFLIVVEGRPGTSRRPLSENGTDRFPVFPPAIANFQMISNRPLGNGSAEICDEGPTLNDPNRPAGGVPAASSFADAAAIDDLACRFVFHNVSQESCTFDRLGNFSFVSPASTGQYCISPAVGQELAFRSGEDTTLRVRLVDTGGNIGDELSIIVRIPPRNP